MDSNKKYPSVDPVDLINEHYEAVEMPDDFRRELQIASRNIIAQRQRKHISAWKFSFAGLAALVALVILGRLMYMGQHGGQTAPVHKQPPMMALDKRPSKKMTNSVVSSKSPKAERNIATSTYYPSHKSALPVANNNQPNKQEVKDNSPVAVLISAMGIVTDASGKQIELGERICPGTEIRTSHGGRATFVTRKGSELNLDSNTKLVFTSDKIAKIISGRLYCANRDKEIALIETPAGSVKLLGTVVDTNVLRKDTVAVTVVEGKVELSNRYGNMLVSAGNKSLMAAYSAPKSGAKVNTYNETAWYQGRGDYESDFGDIPYAVKRNDQISEIWTIKSDGSKKHRLASFIGYPTELGPWLPGERWFSVSMSSALWTTPDTEKKNARAGAGHPIIKDSFYLPNWLIDAATGNIRSLNYLPDGYSGFYFSMAPDPTLMAFAGWYRENKNQYEHGVFLTNRSSTDVKCLIKGNIKTTPAWSPDSRHIVISTGQDYTNDHKLEIVDVQSGQVQDLDIYGAGACFSPDGTKIAYCGDFKKGGSWYAGVPTSGSIFILDLVRGSDPLRISPKHLNSTRPRWSPDGKRLSYIGDDIVYVVNADGSDSKEVYHSNAGSICRASWAAAGNKLFITDGYFAKAKTYVVSADGSSIKEVFSQAAEDNVLSKKCQQQTDAATAAIREAIFYYAMGNVHSFEGNLAARRESYIKSRDVFSRLVWDYPLSGLRIDDVMQYADAADKELQRTDDENLEDSCKFRIGCLKLALSIAAAKYHQFPQDMATALEWASNSTWQYGWLRSCDKQHVTMLGTCPGSANHPSVSYTYHAPAERSTPDIGDVILECPIHTDNDSKWDDSDARTIDRKLIVDGIQGAWCKIENGLPYYFENVGSGNLTIIHHQIGDTYEVMGEAKLLPTGEIYNNESIKLPEEEAVIGREIMAIGALDWGNLPADEVTKAQANLKFCQAIAAYESGQQADDPDGESNLYNIIDGEPAKLLFCGPAGGSCGAYGSDLRFELVGPERIELYQLKPSGRFHVDGTVKVVQTGQTCKNGWIDKNGNVISTEK